MGRPKQLLPWGETTVLGQVLQNLQRSRIDDLLVVTGHVAAAVAAEAQKVGVRTIHNPAYQSGEMLSSIQAGVRDLPAGYAAILVMLADQPMITSKTIDCLLDAYRTCCGALVAPVYQGRRGNPVIIDQQYFGELLALPPGSAPRELLQKHESALCLVPVEEAGVLIDIDRPEMYARWRPEGTAGY
jgi:molybdenum cofactor cytidylyltransferase